METNNNTAAKAVSLILVAVIALAIGFVSGYFVLKNTIQNECNARVESMQKELDSASLSITTLNSDKDALQSEIDSLKESAELDSGWKELAPYYVYLFQGMVKNAIMEEDMDMIDTLFDDGATSFIDYWSEHWPIENAKEAIAESNGFVPTRYPWEC